MVKEINEDEFFKRITSDSDTDLMFGEFQDEEYLRQEIENDRRHTMFATWEDRIRGNNMHSSKFLKNMNTNTKAKI